jgi:hypothetical protein
MGENMAKSPKGAKRAETPEAIAERLQSILINAAEGRRSISDDGQYSQLRRKLDLHLATTPELLRTHPSVDSFSAYIKGINSKRERVKRVRHEFGPLLGLVEKPSNTDSSAGAWTGIESGIARVRAVKSLLPLAQSAVEGLIAALSAPNANGAPLLDQHEEAIENLRCLHQTLGSLLDAADCGHLDDELGSGLAAEAARYAKRAARALSRDPMPYLSSGLLLGILTACGFPGIGGYLADITLNIRKNSSSNER